MISCSTRPPSRTARKKRPSSSDVSRWEATKLDISPHDLRHRFGYVMAEQVPLHRLAQIMGHDSLDTTARHTRATQRDLQAKVEKIAWQ
ncbi:tyrosine-type recombinase/integrase [Deinococcus aerophilus]|uniref:Tyr recombinase domain-containing protein n=1 Tax=Deinococcus aerophilus TaxID=522488 RepID=A0ABQ2GY10_9DEIO|nr:hypothetical protein GCM10010841_26250 [Deinococcus aerophilus]